jgi:hypothetical protein
MLTQSLLDQRNIWYLSKHALLKCYNISRQSIWLKQRSWLRTPVSNNRTVFWYVTQCRLVDNILKFWRNLLPQFARWLPLLWQPLFSVLEAPVRRRSCYQQLLSGCSTMFFFNIWPYFISSYSLPKNWHFTSATSQSQNKLNPEESLTMS